ncbi:unnamed protein product [Albugo candida]|uniref:Uncharacterized protein n=1 Tax=Albugo candida TaxID=65357 RepID=A0A024FTB4_9STRA|nr:unnamed protein product [Albugo candida]|eukprot:CCI10338.1 unnamed protein product [Albugo candida]
MEKIGIDTRGRTIKYNFFCKDEERGRIEKMRKRRGEKWKEPSKSLEKDSRAEANTSD